MHDPVTIEYDIHSSYEGFTWRISDISSIQHKVDYFVQSPSFSYDGSNWIFKMYPYGQTEYHSEGYMDFVIERIHSEYSEQTVYCKIYCKSPFEKEFIEKKSRYVFDATCPEAKVFRFMQNLKDNPKKWQYAPNDTFTIVFAMSKACYLKTNTDGITEGERSTTNKSREIGEIYKDCFFKEIACKICTQSPCHPLQSTYQIPPFSLANALWTLKVHSYIQIQDSNNRCFDVTFERLHSDIPQHYGTLKFSVEQCGPWSPEFSGTFFFSPNHACGDVISFQQEKHAGNWFFKIEVKMMVGTESDSVTELTKRDTVSGNKSNIKILQDYKQLYLKQENCDVVIKVQGREFPAHKIILGARSPVLSTAFRTDMKEKATGVVDVEDCDPSAFPDFLCFLYSGEVELTKDNVFSLFVISDKYDVPDLRSMCMEFIKLNLSIDTFCDTITLALQYSEVSLLELSTEFFKKNLHEMIITTKWQSFVVSHPIESNELMIKALIPKKN